MVKTRFNQAWYFIVKLILIIVALQKHAYAANAIERFERLGKDRLCLAQVVPVDFHFSFVMSVWFTDPASKLYLPVVFDNLVAQHKGFMDELDAYSKETTGTPTDFGSLRDAIDKSAQRSKDLGVKLNDLSGVDQNFIDSLNKIEIQLAQVLGAVEKVQGSCQHSVELAATLQTIVDETKKAASSVHEMRHYLGQIQTKRIFMLKMVQENIEKDLKTRFANITNQKLDQIEADVEGVFGLVRFIDDLEDWWFRVVVRKGAARGYLATTFQFNSAIAVIGVDLKTLEEFQKRLSEIRAPDGAKQTAQNSINSKMNLLKTYRDEAMASGWEGFLGKQLTVTNRFRELKDILILACNEAVDAYLALPSDNSQLANRVAKDRAFIEVSTLCRKGRK